MNKPDEKKKPATTKLLPGKIKLSFKDAQALTMRRHAGAFATLAKR